MDKQLIKELLIFMIVASYFINLLVVSLCGLFEVLIANVVVWLILVLLILGFRFVCWLNDWE